MAEVNLGSVSNNTIARRSNTVGGSDTIDTYSFNVGNGSDVNISLTGMSADADIRLFRDFNGNGIVDSNDQRLSSSTRNSNADETINLSSQASDVDGGSYVVEVDPFLSASTRYDLKVSASAISDPSLLLPAEREVGTLTSRRTFGDSLSLFDTVDTYRFNVTSGRTYNFTASDDSPFNVDMRLIRDGGNNREVDNGDVLAQSFGQSNGTEAINQFLSPGTYYLQVDHLGATNYTLNMG